MTKSLPCHHQPMRMSVMWSGQDMCRLRPLLCDSCRFEALVSRRSSSSPDIIVLHLYIHSPCLEESHKPLKPPNTLNFIETRRCPLQPSTSSLNLNRPTPAAMSAPGSDIPNSAASATATATGTGPGPSTAAKKLQFPRVDLEGHDLPPSPAPSSPHAGRRYAIATELVYTEGTDQYNASSVPIYQVWHRVPSIFWHVSSCNQVHSFRD